MSTVFSPSGWRALAPSWATLGAAVVAGLALVIGSHWYLEREKRETRGYDARVKEARTKLDAARRERDSLQESSEVFRTLVDRGLLKAERRLDLVELVNGLRAQYHLFGLDYEVAPQRALALAGNRVFPAVDVLASRVKLKLRALHEGDVIGFVSGLAQSNQGFYPVDRCTLKRIEVADPASLQARVEAECTLEWITLRDKAAGRAS